MPKALVAGNWKMNGLRAALVEIEKIDAHSADKSPDVLICPATTLLSEAAEKTTKIAIGAQDCHQNTSGAHTGDISPEMIRDAGASYVILGHSERRVDHGESDALVNDKTQSAWAAGLRAIICVGETLEQRKAGKASETVAHQLRNAIPTGATADNLAIAYEPVWAIGTGLVPELNDIDEMHRMIRAELRDIGVQDSDETRILYGGSMKASNATEIAAIEDVNGGLVGGASLSAEQFCPIIDAFSN